jgi:hypothetical protein
MAKTIGQLTELGATPEAADMLPISDNNVTKKISVSNLTAAALGLPGAKTVGEGTNLVLGTVTGTKIGTATAQKLGFWNATPVDQPALTADLLDSLQELGLVAAGTGDTPLDLGAGAVTCGTITVGDGANIVLNATTGTKLATATTQKLGFWNSTPAVQPAAVADLTVTASSGTLPTPDGSVTVDAASPSGASLLEYCVEIEAKLEDLLAKLRTIGLIAT